jgi:membrane protein YdbS with pleckstrin-like domain
MDKLAPLSPATSAVARLLSVPHEPVPPAGAPESIRTFRAASNFYRYRLAQWVLKQLGAVAGLVFGLAILSQIPQFPGRFVLDLAEALGVVGLVVAIPFTYLLVHLDYQLRWYIVTDRSLRIREGVVRIVEKTMSYANIQNVAIRQGPLQRFFGIADVEVRTAGGGAGGAEHKGESSMHLGYFRGVENAEEIRDVILARVRQLRDSGIGDPDPDLETGPPAGGDVLVAARELLDEARALGRASRHGG